MSGGGGGGGSQEVAETQEQRALAQVAAERWNHYQKAFVPLENDLMRRVDERSAPAATDHAQGLTHTAYRGEADKAAGMVARGMAERGIDPSSGRMQAGVSEARTGMAGAEAQANTQAAVTAQDRHIAGLENIVAIGNNQAGTSVAGLSDIARVSAARAEQDAQIKFSERQSRNELIGSIAGAGTSMAMSGAGKGFSWNKAAAGGTQGVGMSGQATDAQISRIRGFA